MLIKKSEEGFRRLLTPFQPLSLTPLNKKIDFQGPLLDYRRPKNLVLDKVLCHGAAE